MITRYIIIKFLNNLFKYKCFAYLNDSKSDAGVTMVIRKIGINPHAYKYHTTVGKNRRSNVNDRGDDDLKPITNTNNHMQYKIDN